FSIVAFRLLGKDIPYNLSEEVEATLQERGAVYDKHPVAYQLTFPDTEENRMRISRFLLADHLAQMPRQPLLDWFDQYSHSGQIDIQTFSDHFTIRSKHKGRWGR